MPPLKDDKVILENDKTTMCVCTHTGLSPTWSWINKLAVNDIDKLIFIVHLCELRIPVQVLGLSRSS